MRFALNYSPEAVDLLAAGKISFDLYKLPDWEGLVDEVRATYPVYVHFGLAAGSPPKEPVNWALVERFLRETETNYVNVHLGVWRGVIPESDVLDMSDGMIERVTEMMREDLLELVARFGKDRVIAENVFCQDQWGLVMQACTLPDVFTSIVNEADCGLLLDTAHAKMAAFSLGIPVQEYIEAMPVERLRELHVTGFGYHPDGRLWDHMPMRADDWVLYEWAMDQVHHNPHWGKPYLVACEYGGVGEMFRPYSEAAALEHDVPRMVAAIRADDKMLEQS